MYDTNKQYFDFFFLLFTAVFSQNKMYCLCLTLKREGAEKDISLGAQKQKSK